MKNNLMTRPESFMDAFLNDGWIRDFSFGNNIDIYHENNQYVVEVNIPGFKKEEIKVHFENDILSIEAQHEEESDDSNKEYVYRSRSQKSYSRQIRFKSIDESNIVANYQDGILKVELKDRVPVEKQKQLIEVK